MIESQEIWTDILEDKDTHSLRELAQKYGVGVGGLAEAFRRTGTKRVASPPKGASQGKPAIKKSRKAKGTGRPGSKDAVLESFKDQLGNKPDAEIAAAAGVSARTVASFRTRHGIAAYSGKRTRAKRKSKVAPYRHLIGKIPDREIAERASVSLNTVRNYRVSLGIKALGRSGAAKLVREQRDAGASPTAAVPVARAARAAAPSGRDAWSVTLDVSGTAVVQVVVGDTLAEVAEQANAAATSLAGSVTGLSRVGPFFQA